MMSCQRFAEFASTATAVASSASEANGYAVAYSNQLGSSGYGSAGGDAWTILGVVISGGFTSQPSALTSTTSGKTITLSSTAKTGLGAVNGSHNSTWYAQVNGKWTKLATVGSEIWNYGDKTGTIKDSDGNTVATYVISDTTSLFQR
ncbi:hypothetical protein L3X07_13135 [Levilactobacillus brevis]|nr:hypothetical protein [Levilactobacillus brevis]